jgi:BON domain
MDRKKNVAKVQETAAALAEKVRDAKLDERAAEFATLARDKVREAELDARAGELAAKVRDAAVVEQVAETAGHVAESARDAVETALDRMGERLSDSKVGERLVDTKVGDALGVHAKKRRKPWALLTAGAIAAGVAAGLVLFRRKEQQQSDIEWDTGGLDSTGDLQRSDAPGVALPLEGRVREAIGSDARTSTMPALNINVVDGTVFVRGTVTSEVDQDALRAVIEGVEGVTDVDLQVTVGT